MKGWWQSLSRAQKAWVIFGIGVAIIIPMGYLLAPVFRRMIAKTKLNDVLVKNQNSIKTIYDNIVSNYGDKLTGNFNYVTMDPHTLQQMTNTDLNFISAYKGGDIAEFKAKVLDTANALGVDPNALMGIMYFETEHTLSPSIQNGIGATGLIQFMPDTAIGLGTTVDELKKMSGSEQMDYVKKYFMLYQGKYKQPIDVYLAVFFPAAIGQSDDTVIEKLPHLTREKIAAANPIFDEDKKGYITVGNIKDTLIHYIS